MNLARIPEGVSLAAGVMATDMITTGFSAVEMADIGYGDTVVVIGIGPVGLMSVAGAALRGAGRIIAVGSRPVTRELAVKYGAETTVDYKDGDLREQLNEILGAKKADAVIIAGGNEDTVSLAMGSRPCLRPRRQSARPLRRDTDKARRFRRVLRTQDPRRQPLPGRQSAYRAPAQHSEVRRLDADALITHEFRGLDAIEPAFDIMADKPENLVKPIVYM